MNQKTPMLLALLMASMSSTACMTFNGQELPRRDLPEHGSFRPLISTRVGKIQLLHNGKEGAKPALTATGIGDLVVSTVLVRWKSEQLIDDYGKPGELERDPDYTLQVSGTQDEESSILASVVTGLTLYLFPSSATINRAWEFELTRVSSGQTYSVSAQQSVTTWLHLIFLPVFPLSVVGQMNADRDLSHFVYDELAKQGAWQLEAAASP